MTGAFWDTRLYRPSTRRKCDCYCGGHRDDRRMCASAMRGESILDRPASPGNAQGQSSTALSRRHRDDRRRCAANIHPSYVLGHQRSRGDLLNRGVPDPTSWDGKDLMLSTACRCGERTNNRPGTLQSDSRRCNQLKLLTDVCHKCVCEVTGCRVGKVK